MITRIVDRVENFERPVHFPEQPEGHLTFSKPNYICLSINITPPWLMMAVTAAHSGMMIAPPAIPPASPLLKSRVGIQKGATILRQPPLNHHPNHHPPPSLHSRRAIVVVCNVGRQNRRVGEENRDADKACHPP
jgi:hypothetical protein